MDLKSNKNIDYVLYKGFERFIASIVIFEYSWMMMNYH